MMNRTERGNKLKGVTMPMQNNKALRQHLLSLLKGGNAHVDFDAAVKDLPVSVRGTRPDAAEHSPWELLEHLRIAQWDILEFSRNPHRSEERRVGKESRYL